MRIMRIFLKFALMNPRKMFHFCQFALINPRINFVKKTFFASIFFSYIYITYFLYIKCVILIDNYSNWCVDQCLFFFSFSTTMSISPSFFSAILRKSCLMSWPCPWWFSLVFFPRFVLFSDVVSLFHACPTGGKAKNEPRTSLPLVQRSVHWLFLCTFP